MAEKQDGAVLARFLRESVAEIEMQALGREVEEEDGED